MIKIVKLAVILFFSLTLLAITSCASKKESKEAATTNTAVAAVPKSSVNSPAPIPAQLPVRYQNPGYITTNEFDKGGLDDNASEYQIKVGATIRSTGGPQPLWEVIKRLVNLKGMTVSWASDVDQTIPVDVDISATDHFYDAISNLLRQADYYHEVKGKSIIVRNKATKVYQVGIPAMQGNYTTNIGGNFLSSQSASSAASGTEGTVKINSADNKFNVWDNIEKNLKVILQTAEAERVENDKPVVAAPATSNPPIANANPAAVSQAPANSTGSDKKEAEKGTSKVAHNTARDGSTFIIDKNIGLITVTAKPNVLKTVDSYIDNLKKHLYRQVRIEAKIIEVWLQDNSKLGLDWSSVLGGDTAIGGTVSFGSGGQIHPHTSGGNPDIFSNTFVSRLTLNSISFEVFINALNEQGDTHILSNPKLTVLNGQPAIISVGKDVAYVKQVTAEVDSETNTVTYSAESGNVVEGIALGVMATIRDDKTMILHLTPITTSLENLDENGDIPTTTIGTGPAAVQLGLPKVKVREMSTMVEVQDGEMLVIGGLIDSIDDKSEKFAPGLGSIPGLRYLFGVEKKIVQKRELVILLTPKVI
jgi:general secretion pathway protein D/MSHA biogenesis protein MshL